MSYDISGLLSDWEHEPGKVAVRRFLGDDGREKIQLRIDLGILQMNAEGRPDGRRPFGHESLFEHFKAKLDAHEASGDDFHLTDNDCLRLHQEAVQYYHRYICLFELKDFAGVVRDTERNLELFDFIDEFADSDEMAALLDQMRPQVVMMFARARSALELAADNFENAISVVEEGLEEIKEYYENQGVDDPDESCGELQFLHAWMAELESLRPVSEKERLQNALDLAIRQEDYEKAAKMRDALRRLDQSST